MFLGRLHWGDDLKGQIYGPVISDPGTLYVQDDTDALSQAWDEGAKAALRSEGYANVELAHVLSTNPYRNGDA